MKNIIIYILISFISIASYHFIFNYDDLSINKDHNTIDINNKINTENKINVDDTNINISENIGVSEVNNIATLDKKEGQIDIKTLIKEKPVIEDKAIEIGYINENLDKEKVKQIDCNNLSDYDKDTCYKYKAYLDYENNFLNLNEKDKLLFDCNFFDGSKYGKYWSMIESCNNDIKYIKNKNIQK